MWESPFLLENIMEILLLIGITIFLGTLSGKFFQKMKIPQVTGYIIVGLLLGQSGFKMWSPDSMEALTPVVSLALGLIGFMLGSELKFDLFRNRGRSIYSILFSQGLFTFFIVTTLVTLVTGKLYFGILLGAIATATDPAATVDVLWENKAKGVFTSTLLAIVALDDVLALFIYAFAALFAKTLLQQAHFSFHHLIDIFVELGIGITIGLVGGFILYWLTHFIKDRERILPFSLGVIALIVGASSYFKIDLILASMLAGITLGNIAPIESKEIVDAVKKFSVPVYIIFFVLVGARLDIASIFVSGAAVLLLVYILTRAFGKVMGAYLGGVIGKAQTSVTRYLGLGLLSQAGVAIGMAISIGHNLSHLGPEANAVGVTIVNIAVATTFVFQLTGPLCVRLAAVKAGETGKNVTEEDIIDSYKVADLIEKDVPVIQEDTPLDSVVGQVKTSESNDFCVVDNQNSLRGSISIGDLRDVLLEQELELNRLVLAKDIAIPSTRVIAASRPLKEAIEILRRKDLDFLPVVKKEDSRELAGLIHYRVVMSQINKELLARRGS